MGILYIMMIGMLIGIVAKFLLPGRDPDGILITALLGIAGALLAKFLGEASNWYEPVEAAGFIASVIGSIFLLVLYRLIFSRRINRA